MLKSDDEDGSKNEFREDALLASSSLLQSPTTEGIVFSEVGASGKTTVESTDSQDKDSSPPPPSIPQHNAVKDLLVNRYMFTKPTLYSFRTPCLVPLEVLYISLSHWLV